MHRSISINTLCFAQGGIEEHVEIAARCGSRGISPHMEQVTALGAATTARLIRDAKLQIATLTHRAFGFATSEEAEAGRERLLRTIDVAAEIGAQSITMTTGGRGSLTWGEAANRFGQTIRPCKEAAKQAGVVLAVEPTSHLYADVSIAHGLSDTVRIARLAGIATAIDLFACWTDADLEEAISQAAPMTTIVQVSDYVFGDRALPCRAVPGDGAIPFAQIMPAIVKAGFNGWFDLEIIGPRLWSEGEANGLARAADVVGQLLCDSGLPHD